MQILSLSWSTVPNPAHKTDPGHVRPPIRICRWAALLLGQRLVAERPLALFLMPCLAPASMQ
jgi:hypothetical protein